MNNSHTHELLSARLAADLDALEQAVDGLQVLTPTGGQRTRVADAIQRARSALHGAGEPILTIVLAGGTGVGKSTVINALAGDAIAEVSPQRPTTDVATLYVHRAVHASLLPRELGERARTIVHDRPELRYKLVIDTPDLDSFRTAHREYTRRLLTGADLVLLVTSSEKYYDEKVWSVIDAERDFKQFAVLLNKIDQQPEPADRQAILEDLAGILSRQGLDGARVYAVHAAFHAPSAAVRPKRLAEGDQFAELTAWIQEGLRRADIEGIKRRQSGAVVSHMHRQVSALKPANPAADVEHARAAAHQALEQWVEQLTGRYDRAMRGMESAIRPAVVLASHERFSGLFRAYLAVVDAVRFGLRWLVTTCLRRPTRSLRDVLTGGLAGLGTAVESGWPAARSAICQAFARQQLPSVQLEKRLGELPGEDLIRHIETALTDLAEAPEGWAVPRSSLGLRLFNFVAAVLPVGLLGWAGWRLGVEFYFARYVTAPALIWHAVVLLALLLLGLHGVSALLFGVKAARVARRMRQEARALIARQVAEWIEPPLERYRADLVADCRSLETPLENIDSHLQEAYAGPESLAGVL